MFKVGDRVKDYLTFRIGTIIEIVEGVHFPYTVKFDDGSVDGFNDREIYLCNTEK